MLQQQLLAITELVCFLNSEGAPVKQVTGATLATSIAEKKSDVTLIKI